MPPPALQTPISGVFAVMSRLLTLPPGRQYTSGMDRRVNSAPRAGIQLARKKQILIFHGEQGVTLRSVFLNVFLCLCGFFYFLLADSGCSLGKEKISIIATKGDQVIEYAAIELSEILKGNFIVGQSDALTSDGWNIVLRTDPGMKPFSFSVVQSKNDKNKTIYLSGYDQTCVLHSVYTMLEMVGYTFDITGIRYPKTPSFKDIIGYSETINPVVERRGIRQHINFLMDISSYPLEEAQEYIRNLARLRMNYITFHSYPGQWFSYNYKGNENLAGNFFYGEENFVPKDEHLKKVVRNDSIYCIPAIEPFWNNPPKRSQMAIGWLNSVMAEAKRVGLTVNMSYELREYGLEYALATSTAILEEYPLIDGLELISEEDIGTYIDQIKNNIKCSEELKKHQNGRKIQLTNGIYNTTAGELKEGFEILRNTTSKDMCLSVLPAHGARMAVKNLSGIPLTSDDLKRTMIYSWIEFDGLMYLQQNPVEGIRMMIEENLKITGNKPLFGISWNHWRTFENRIAVRYASEAMIDGPISSQAFYHSIAKRLEIGNAAMFASAMTKLDEADTFCRDNLFNIGFCPNGYWLKKTGLSLYGRFPKDKLLSAINQFSDAQNDLNKCIVKTKNGSNKRDLQFLENRINCTMLHLNAFVAMTDLKPLFKGNPDPDLSQQDREKVLLKCSEALALENQYIDLHAQFIGDRGSEGTLVSYMGGPLQTLKNIMSRFGNANDSIPKSEKPSDAPPEPGQKIFGRTAVNLRT